MIKLNTYGEIIEGNYKGWYIFIEKLDRDNYQLFISNTHPQKDIKPTEVFDYYMDNMQSLEAQIEYEDWIIEWHEDAK